jgi:hypothetical protein
MATSVSTPSFRHALDERILERRNRFFGELAGDRLVDLGRPRQQLLIDRRGLGCGLPRGLEWIGRLSHHLSRR